MARKQLVGLDLHRAEYSLLRLRHCFNVGGNKCGRLLANTFRAQRQSARVDSLGTTEGVLVEGDELISSQSREFSSILYSEQSLSLGNSARYLQITTTTWLTEAQAVSLNSPIRIEEVIPAISRQKPLKSPGPDSFATGFYNMICPELAPILTRLFNSIPDTATLPPSM